MVYCQQCGTDNEEDAEFCVKCGATLNMERGRRRPPKKQDECFGLPQGGSIFGIIFGIMIILFGARELLGWKIDFGPFLIIVVGILIIAGAIYKSQRK
jgi:uncharacterized membrane protein YvbJ